MKRVVFVVVAIVCVLGFAGFAAAEPFQPLDGLYYGTVQIQGNLPNACKNMVFGEHWRFTNLPDGKILFQDVLVFPDGYELIYGEAEHDLQGRTVHFETQASTSDIGSYFGLDALVTNTKVQINGLYTSPTSYTQVEQVSHQSCEGADCAVLAQILMGDEGFWPCDIPPRRFDINWIAP